MLRIKSWRAVPAATAPQVQPALSGVSMPAQDKALAVACVTALFPIAIGMVQGTIPLLEGLSEALIAVGGVLKAFISS